jgi:hypothetical protein
MKVLANMWKNLDPEIKSHYQTIAENDKSRYFAEMKVFECFPPQILYLFNFKYQLSLGL